MALRQVPEAAARIKRLFDDTRQGHRKVPRLQLSKEQFKRIVGRKQLKDTTFNEIAGVLSKSHGLVLGRSEDQFIIIPISECAKWTAAPASAVARELRLSAPFAWPFPKGNKP